MKVKEALNALNEAFPFELAEEWDNVGLLLGDPEWEVTGAVVALDASEEALDCALASGANLLITHHPGLFRARKRFAEVDAEAKLLCRMIRESVAMIAAHTNYDNAPGGMNDQLAKALGLENVCMLENGLRMGEYSGKDLCEHVKNTLNTPVRAYGAPKMGRVAVCGGAGGEFWKVALAAGADAFVTGEIRYHEALDAARAGLYVLEAGHAATEEIGLDAIAQVIGENIAIFR